MRMQNRREKLYAALGLLLWLWVNLWAFSRYEPWRDMAQSWLIARDLDLPELFVQLKQEGHPCLWYLLLMPLSKLGLPYQSAQWLSMALMAAALWLFWTRAPFGKGLRFAVTLGATGVYYLPVIARSYALVPPLLMLLYLAYPTRQTRAWRYAALLALLSQTHALMCGLAGMMMLQWALEALCEVRGGRAPLKSKVGPLCLLLLSVAFLGWQLLGSVAANAEVAPASLAGLGALKDAALQRLSELCEWLTGMRLYAPGNTAFGMVLLPFALIALALVTLWLWRAPRSGWMLVCGLGWQGAVYVLLYGPSMQRALIGLWVLLLCGMLATDELKARVSPLDHRVKRLIGASLLLVCTLTFAKVYPALRSECAWNGVNSCSGDAAAYIEQSLPQNAVVLLESEPKASAVAAYCPAGRFYNPIRHNWRAFSLIDGREDGWCAQGDLDAAVTEVRAQDHDGPIYLLAERDAMPDAEAMSERGTAHLALTETFFADGTDECYALYEIVGG